MTTRELQVILRSHGKSTVYRLKTDLLERLAAIGLTGNILNRSRSEADLTDIFREQEVETNLKSVGIEQETCEAVGQNLKVEMSGFSFRDVEEALEEFAGEGQNVEHWLVEFEEVAKTCGWSDVQRYLFARRLLRGAAKLAVESESGARQWSQLKDLLRREFSLKISGRQLHELLSHRTKQSDETFAVYCYSMKKLSMQGDIDEQSLLEYIVGGIVDDPVNKTLLYGATNLDDLKAKLKIYERIKIAQYTNKTKSTDRRGGGQRSMTTNSTNPVAVTAEMVENNNDGGQGPSRNNNRQTSRGPRCYRCGQFGHIVAVCNAVEVLQPPVVNQIQLPPMYVYAVLNGYNVIALVDTGSDVTVVRENVYNNITSRPEINGSSMPLTCFGFNTQRTVGSFPADITINRNKYRINAQLVEARFMQSEMLIGKDILNQSTVVVRKGVVEFLADEDVVFEQMNVLALIEPAQLDVSDIRDPEVRRQVMLLEQQYEPCRRPQSCVKLALQLVDDAPVFQSPRRLAPREQIAVANRMSGCAMA